VQLWQWLTLSVRDYHATPLGLVALLQMPGVARKAMKSQAKAKRLRSWDWVVVVKGGCL
jgi:hypothetical protein